ncbi:MAG: hypothetical protein EOO89_16900, partial [Pedobacter sp.]
MKQKIQLLFKGADSRHTILNVLFSLFLLAQLFRLVRQLLYTYGIDSWHISEFLINYQGGFVRRGLFGELLLLFTQYTNINVELTIKALSLIFFFAVCSFFIRAFIRKGYSLYILPLCFFLGMGILSGNLVRKDYLMIYFLILILKVYQGSFSKAVKILGINVLFILALLNHEAFAFFSLPVVLLLVAGDYKEKGFVKASLLSGLTILPAILCFFLTLYYHGDAVTAQAIWDSLQVIANNSVPKVLTGDHWHSIAAIGWKSETTFQSHFKMNFLAFDRDLLSFFVWCITFPVVYYLATNALLVFRKSESIFTERHKTVLSTILIFQLVCLIPLFTILSCDYVRIFFYWIVSSFAIFLIVPFEKVEGLTPSFAGKKIQSLNTLFAIILIPRRSTVVMLMLFIGISSYTFFVDQTIDNSM